MRVISLYIWKKTHRKNEGDLVKNTVIYTFFKISHNVSEICPPRLFFTLIANLYVIFDINLLCTPSYRHRNANSYNYHTSYTHKWTPEKPVGRRKISRCYIWKRRIGQKHVIIATTNFQKNIYDGYGECSLKVYRSVRNMLSILFFFFLTNQRRERILFLVVVLRN